MTSLPISLPRSSCDDFVIIEKEEASGYTPNDVKTEHRIGELAQSVLNGAIIYGIHTCFPSLGFAARLTCVVAATVTAQFVTTATLPKISTPPMIKAYDQSLVV